MKNSLVTPAGPVFFVLLASLAGAEAAIAATGQHSPGLSCGDAGTVWTVQGVDERGTYTGQLELIPGANGHWRFIRVIDYDPNYSAEDGRGVSAVWQGDAVTASDGSVDLSVDLKKADFVRRGGGLERTPEDRVPVRVTGRFTVQEPCILTGSYRFAEAAVNGNETWSLPSPGGDQPIFALQVSETPTHNAIPANTRDAWFAWFASFHALPEVQPYVNLPAFRHPLHTVIRDQTDFAFYQQHPERLRVVNKVIDPISLLETRARADAYRWTLAGKADFFERDTAELTIDPATGMLFEALDQTGKGYPSPDGALWTGAYVASQFCRYAATGDESALPNIARSAAGLLTLLEITGDRRVFARTLRRAEGQPTPPWYPGAAPHASLEWLALGNNDMYKGVMFGLTAAQAALCGQPGRPEYAALCERLRSNVIQAAEKLDMAQGSGYNRLATLWLAAYSTGRPSAIKEARKEWNRQAAQLADGSRLFYTDGIADWSGTHLSAVQYLMFFLLADRYPLPGIDSKPVLRQGIENVYREFSRIPLGLWSVVFARLGTLPHADAANNARWRLRELPTPKTQLAIDHRISADFVMSPFPSAPWKLDWTRNERTQSLRAYPLFEASAYTVYDWKQSPFEYVAFSEGIHFPGADYLLAYWLGRLTGVFAASD